ncbi:RagB/SusD family nutrient uptake outer membrane protein [Pedobacter sp. MC2016-14]|uniref:RagB/SusD family nutrient uptake outer membrane protein n=1 Tax=Pedobacter sp. MC2016-14 TaxID=2897327 RepID=UPI001E591A08|nr:RagB/SusD family nutrient uptake outer membrane protein [Pedobacter sp. MC2016-14]MCD0487659.1 RagB/SusD family nutrient uptake outer membrane protein [Pedobacter sp. MC2016-14]
MKTYIKLLSCAVILFCGSCKKYLDLVPAGSKIVESAQDYYNLVSYPNRAYVITNFQYLVDDQWMKESDVIGKTNLNTVNFTFDETQNRVNLISSSNFYSRSYVYINRWNTIISLVDDSHGDENIKVLAKAEAKALRAFDYFLLINVYAKAYNPATAATDGGICLMEKYDLEAQPVKSTVKDAYDLIQKDLDEAIPFLQQTPKDVYHPSLAFAWALKAKVHLFKKEFAQAKDAALKSLTYNDQIFDLVAYSRQGGPTSVLVPAANNPEVLSYQYMTGYNEMSFGYNYVISPELKTLFGTNDARYNLFFNSVNASFLDIGAGTAYWSVAYTRFFYSTVGLKTTEVYLMLAETYAREGNRADAIAIINKLRAKRIVSGTVDYAVPATVKETMDIVISERRKELLFGFNRFFDLKRLNTEPDYAKTIVRVFPIVNTTVPKQTYTLKPDSRLYVIPFPKDVLLINRGLTLNTDETLPF